MQGRHGGIAIATQGEHAGLVVEVPSPGRVIDAKYLLPYAERLSIELYGLVVFAFLVVVKTEQLEGPGHTQMFGTVRFLRDLQSSVEVLACTFDITTIS